jgi:hypothetical protein
MDDELLIRLLPGEMKTWPKRKAQEVHNLASIDNFSWFNRYVPKTEHFAAHHPSRLVKRRPARLTSSSVLKSRARI